ncbi:uncharacterized protein LOC107420863 [Ziziphus jujuba]|uniref:Uncharacterized protein LOC107420863 n=1 Tax=Ziziphus jujuba TaxID=326968 RepID=A0ABM4A885_ZIZJJ|nr:uncharacterized protein LOC107420863 [Ziziphus jujuba]
MDSGNSGSMQSSSGGDEEYDSRPESIPSFLNPPPPPPTHFGSSDSNPEPSLLSHFQNHQSAGFFDISSNYFQALSQSQPNSNPNFLLNLDTVRSRPQRSEPLNCTELGNLAVGGASSLLASQGSGPGLGPGLSPSHGPGPSVIQLRSVNNEAAGHPGRGTASQTNNNQGGRNSKKRTRASRRAPTTVLTTDTSNFRAMVQEFTGIPAPPFSGSSYSRRFDLFGTAGGGSAMRSGNMDTLGPLYPLRPSPQKVHHQSPFLSSSSSSSPLLHNNNMIEATNVATTSNNNFLSSSSNYQQHPPPSTSDQVFPKHHHHQHHVLNMQTNPINLPFQSLPLHTSLNVPGFGTRPPQASLSMAASLDELDMSGGGGRGYINTANRGVDPDHGRHELFRALDGNSPIRVSNTSSCKLNYTAASSSEFHPEKGLEMNVSTRGEGTVDSWICPSD